MIRLLLLAPLLVGCHAKFKREAPTLGAVRTQVVTTGAPYVDLGNVGYGGGEGAIALAAAVVNVVQEVKSIDQTARIAGAVKIEGVNSRFERGVSDTLGSGPPFAWTDAPDAPATLQLEVMSWGLTVPYLGAPGEFTYDIRARIYKKDGDRVYSSRTTCTTGAGDPGALEQVLGIVNNVKMLKEMSDQEIHEAFAEVARWCGGHFVTRMRKHAG